MLIQYFTFILYMLTWYTVKQFISYIIFAYVKFCKISIIFGNTLGWLYCYLILSYHNINIQLQISKVNNYFQSFCMLMIVFNWWSSISHAPMIDILKCILNMIMLSWWGWGSMAWINYIYDPIILYFFGFVYYILVL